MPDYEKKLDIFEKRYILAKERMTKCELDCKKAKNRLIAIKSEINEMQGYLENLKAELREKVKLLDEINDKISRN
ncbi:hypothetical protein [Comamonas composti]|uniref:hypothetical protein n=1 Tax=Comamonas composti TaxID=408558 RepID=UPI00047DD5F0|nr:hypothetical protein [Comamonas composti]